MCKKTGNHLINDNYRNETFTYVQITFEGSCHLWCSMWMCTNGLVAATIAFRYCTTLTRTL
jgi:hypothetical protein